MLRTLKSYQVSSHTTTVYLWRIHFGILQNQYNIVKFKNQIKSKWKKKEKDKENLKQTEK